MKTRKWAIRSLPQLALVTAVLFVVAAPFAAASVITGSLSTADGSIIAGDKYAPPPASAGYMITWLITPNGDLTWHYTYTMTTEAGAPLVPLVSHLIIQLSLDIDPAEITNVVGDVSSWVFDTYGPHPSNPGFPEGKSIFGVKFNMGGAQTVVEFDADRKPMWGDFYAKGGKNSFVYNKDLGVLVANPGDYLGIPVDAGGNVLAKILTPDMTIVPEPTALPALGLGLLSLLGLRLRRR
jgi:hypothetical protein